MEIASFPLERAGEIIHALSLVSDRIAELHFSSHFADNHLLLHAFLGIAENIAWFSSTDIPRICLSGGGDECLKSFFGTALPKLQRLSIANFVPQGMRPQRYLTHIWLETNSRCMSDVPLVELRAIVDFLRWTPNLVELVLSDWEGSISHHLMSNNTIVYLPHLQRVTVSSHNPNLSLRLLPSLSFSVNQFAVLITGLNTFNGPLTSPEAVIPTSLLSDSVMASAQLRVLAETTSMRGQLEWTLGNAEIAFQIRASFKSHSEAEEFVSNAAPLLSGIEHLSLDHQRVVESDQYLPGNLCPLLLSLPLRTLSISLPLETHYPAWRRWLAFMSRIGPSTSIPFPSLQHLSIVSRPTLKPIAQCLPDLLIALEERAKVGSSLQQLTLVSPSPIAIPPSSPGVEIMHYREGSTLPDMTLPPQCSTAFHKMWPSWNTKT